MKRRTAAVFALLAAVSASSCDLRPKHAIISIEDPEGLAQNAYLLLFGTDPQFLLRRPILERKFPITVALTSDGAEEKVVWIEAWSAGGDVLARGWVRTTFDVERAPTAVVTLGLPCDMTEECENGAWCDGPETCEMRVCIHGAKPCAPSPFACVAIGCIEEADSCAVGVDHGRCPPIDDGNGVFEASYCDPSIGCARGTPCSGDDTVCQDASDCNGREQCVAGHCVPGPAPAIDDGSPCTIDACVEPGGPAHFPDSFSEGAACTDIAGGNGLCVAGICATSRCGDGFIDPRQEACDDGNENPNDSCWRCAFTTWTATVASGYGTGGGDPLRTPLPSPIAVAVDRKGTLFVADDTVDLVYALDPITRQTVITAGAGPSSDYDSSGLGGPATQATFDPYGLAVDARGNVYITDYNVNQVIMVDAATGLIDAYAGNGDFFGAPEAEGPALQLPLLDPNDLFVDGRGNLYIAESFNSSRIMRVVASTGFMERVAGGTGGEGFGGDGGLAREALLERPRGVVADLDGNVYIADTFNNRVRKVDADTRRISTVAGNGTIGYTGDHGPAVNAELFFPYDVALDAEGHLLITDDNAVIRRVDKNSGVITTIAGTGSSGLGGDGGPAINAEISSSASLAVDDLGNIFIADTENERIRRIDHATGVIETVMGDLSRGIGATIGIPATSAQIASATQIALDASGAILFREDYAIRRIEPASGLLYTEYAITSTETLTAFTLSADGALLVAYQGSVYRVDRTTGSAMRIAGDGTGRNASGDGGPATAAGIGRVECLATDANNNLFIGERDGLYTYQVRRVDAATQRISTITGGDRTVISVSALLADAGGNLYVADSYNGRVRLIDAARMITTIAGNGTRGAGGDGGPATNAELDTPRGLAFDHRGRLLISDPGARSRRVRRVDLTTGTIDTAVRGGVGASGDGGSALAAGGRFYAAVADGAGDLFLAGENRIRKVDALRGIITSIAGAIYPRGDGAMPQVQLGAPASLVRFGGGNSWLIADGATGRVREVDFDNKRQRTIAGYPEGDESDGAVAAYSRLLYNPTGIAFDVAAKKIYVSETDIDVIRAIDVSVEPWRIHDFAGSIDEVGFRDGAALGEAWFHAPRGLALDEAKRVLYVADSNNHVIRRIDLGDPSHPVTTIAGRPQSLGYFGDGGAATRALLYSPTAVAIGRHDDLYIADNGNHRVRRVDAAGTIRDVLGDGSLGSSGSGAPARVLPVGDPYGLTVDAAGNLFVASGNTLRIVTAGPDGIAAGDDEVITVYGRPPADHFPESLTRCLSGVALSGESPEEQARVMVLDRCRGFLLQLDRAAVPHAPSGG